MSPKKQTDAATELVGVRLPSALVKRIERWSKKAGRMSKSDAIRALIDAGLEAKEGPPAPAWAVKLEELAARLNTNAEGAIEVLREYLDEPEAPVPAERGAQAKPKKRGG